MIPSDLDCCVEISVQRGQGYRFEKHAFFFFSGSCSCLNTDLPISLIFLKVSL